MAVYKPSNCTPFLTCLDLTKAQDITCELNTSNELVTGYKIKILDNNNDVIFEGKKFDPINPNGYENSGLNGSTLTLPLIVIVILFIVVTGNVRRAAEPPILS